jgi:hypothetical protein
MWNDLENAFLKIKQKKWTNNWSMISKAKFDMTIVILKQK